MAIPEDKDMQVILNSGLITSIYIGGTSSTNKVKNESELDATYSKLDGTSGQTKMKFTPQVTPPAYAEGNTFYNDTIGTLDVQGKYSDVTLQVGREMHMEVLNNTASPIPNGYACTQSGVTAGQPTVKLAIADSFDNARIMGIATHEIGIGETGILTTFGEVNGLNTLGVTTGVPLYLSSTVAGTFVETPPDIISRVGGVFVADEFNGKLFAFIINNKNLPSVVGGLQGQTTPLYPLTTTSQDIINYVTTKEIVVTVDALTGEITVPNDGEYRMHFTASISFPSTTSTRSITIEWYDVTNTTILYSHVKNIPRDATEDGLSFSWAEELPASDVGKMRIKANTAMNITFTDISFDIESVNIH